MVASATTSLPIPESENPEQEEGPRRGTTASSPEVVATISLELPFRSTEGGPKSWGGMHRRTPP